MRVCSPSFRNHNLGYGDRGPKSYPWLRKMGQNQNLDKKKIQWNPSGRARKFLLKSQNLVHFHASFFTNRVYFTPHNRPPLFCMKLVKFGPNFVICFGKKKVELGQNGQNLLKYTLGYRASAKIKSLGNGNLAKNRPLDTEIGLKRDPYGGHTPSMVHMTSASPGMSPTRKDFKYLCHRSIVYRYQGSFCVCAQSM